MKEPIKRDLTLSFTISEDTVDVDIYESMYDEPSFVQSEFSPDEHSEFDEDIGRALYAWMKLLLEEQAEEEEDEDDEDEEDDEE